MTAASFGGLGRLGDPWR